MSASRRIFYLEAGRCAVDCRILQRHPSTLRWTIGMSTSQRVLASTSRSVEPRLAAGTSGSHLADSTPTRIHGWQSVLRRVEAQSVWNAGATLVRAGTRTGWSLAVP